jgi:hypothetical protein
MALSSPRFKSSNTLNNVAAGIANLEVGSSGRAVHLVQMALLDLGYAIPSSTSHANYSPDGGKEKARWGQIFTYDLGRLILSHCVMN